MKTINRTAITIRGKAPFVEWVNSFDDGGPALNIDQLHSTAFLIPDKYDEFNFENFIKKNFKIIFESELNSWMTDTGVWPKSRSYKVFKEWFDVGVSDMVYDLAKEPVIAEEY